MRPTATKSKGAPATTSAKGTKPRSTRGAGAKRSATSTKSTERKPLQVVSLKSARRLSEPEHQNYCLLPFFLFAHQLTPQELSKESGIPKRAITLLENAWPIEQKVDMDHIYVLCDYFHCKVEQFFIQMTKTEAMRIRLNFLSMLLGALPSRVGFTEYTEFRRKA